MKRPRKQEQNAGIVAIASNDLLLKMEKIVIFHRKNGFLLAPRCEPITMIALEKK